MTSAPGDPFPWQEPRNSVVRGAFIVVEGVDRAGKTTQVQRVCSKLYALGHNIKSIRFPGESRFCLPSFNIHLLMLSLFANVPLDRSSTIGQMINSYLENETNLDDHVVHLLFSANRWEKA